MKKILLIGASSDICKQLYKDFTSHYEFLLLSSEKEESDYENFDILNRQTYPEISDIDGIVYFPGTINLKPFERTLAAEWSPNIRVNCISPSLVDTKMGSKFFRNEKQIELMNNRHPLKRTGRKTDISNFIEFLLSEKSSWITGQDISIDGGMSTVKA